MNIDTRELDAGLNALLADLLVATPAAEADMADVVVGAAQEIVPVVTGELRDSLHREGNEAIAGAPHAAAVNENPDSRGFGFMVRAIDQSEDALLDAAARALEGLV